MAEFEREFDDDGMPIYTELEKAQQEIQIKDGLLERKNEQINEYLKENERLESTLFCRDTEINVLKELLFEVIERGSRESSY